MIILREKIYSIGEKKALLEIYRKTNGLTTLPQTKNPRDILRFNKFAGDLKYLTVTRDPKQFDRNNAKTLLKNAGLNMSSKQVDRVIDKYSNNEAMERLARLQEKGIIGFGDQSKKFKHLRNCFFNPSKAIKSDNLGKLHENYLLSNPTNKSIMDKIKNHARTKYNIGFENLKGTDPRLNSSFDSFAETSYDLSPISFRKKLRNGVVSLGPHAGASDALHEIGHIVTYTKAPHGIDLKKATRFRGKYYPVYDYENSKREHIINMRNNCFNQISDAVSTMASENSANHYGIKIGKKLGIIPNRDIYNSNISMYMMNQAAHASKNIAKTRYPLIFK